jgi:subtilase family serine protease
MDRMLLVLKRSPKQEASLSGFLTALQDKRSPSFHQWLTPDQFGEQYGPSAAEVQAVTYWLGSEGFRDIRPSKGHVSIEFSGTAQQVQSTFRTAIHKYVENGEEHWANASDPVIPPAFKDVVAGIATLNNFRPRSDIVLRPERALAKVGRSGARRELQFPDGSAALSPGDFNVIYSVPYWYGGGSGTTIAVVGVSNIAVQNVANFRNIFGLSANQPNVIVNGVNPGQVDPAEPLLDVSWAGAIAPQATVDLVVSRSTNATDGLDLSEQYIVDANVADVVTESFSDCEADLGAAEMQFLNSMRQQASAQGMTFIVSAGDNGSAGCDAFSEATASGPLSVSGRASSPYDVAVGGTQFDEALCGVEACWNTYTDSYTTASGHIPEDVWNQSCLAGSCSGSQTPNIIAGSGGPSAIFSKPLWQLGLPGVPDDNARDLPDVSFNASTVHDPYLVCLELTDCVVGTQGVYFHFIGGTSAAAPSFAGIVAQLVGSLGSRQGQINPALYNLESQDNIPDCNGSAFPSGRGPCNFYDITVGSNSVPGQSAFGSPSAPYQAGPGYDLATGLGSVYAETLFENWNNGALQRTTTSLLLSPVTTMSIGAAIEVNVTVTSTLGGGPPTGTVSLVVPNGSVTANATIALSNGSGSILLNSLPFGDYTVYAIYSGDNTFGGSVSAPFAVNFANTVNGCTPTYFGTYPNPIITNSTTASAVIQANAPCGYDIRVGSPDGTLFSTTYGQSNNYAENWVTDGMMFYMQQQGNTTPQGTMASLMVALRPFESSCVVANFSATPNPVISYSGLGVATITANAGCPYDIRVGDWNGPVFMSSQGGLSSAITGEWLTNGEIFYLVTPAPDNSILDTLTVNVQQVAPPCQVETFSATPLNLPIFEWFPGTTISVNSACSYDVRKGTPSGNLVGSGTGAHSYTVEAVENGTVFFLQPQGDTNGSDTLALVTAWTPPRQRGPVVPYCEGSAKRYCY